MKSKTKKNSELEQLRGQIAAFPTVVICAFEGLSVEQDWQLRERVRDSGGEYQVVKNRLARLAAEGTPVEPALGELRGMTSLAFASDDPISLLKALVGYAKEHPVFQFKAGVVEGRVVDVAALNELARSTRSEGPLRQTVVPDKRPGPTAAECYQRERPRLGDRLKTGCRTGEAFGLGVSREA